MRAITITLPDEQWQKLQEIAVQFQINPEEFLRISIEELLSRPDEAFQPALAYILQKNAELYRRLV
ncbi:DNA-binding protein [Chloroflexus islandicus]|uniref:DNA-binding protein n=1 Tax=Chloroflexus islandicus TaxID=1707952 RepID=A0A178MII1_9CHLR|nr:DNA-binding protein [Chloroflexus islandicus]OAN48476.1 DNA-binding protein [Chloroflexus islandicus]